MSDLHIAAGLYEKTFPHNRIIDNAPYADFQGAWSSASPATSDLAYCMYSFTATGFDRAPEVRCAWAPNAPDPSTAWIGLANWTRDCWEWYPTDEQGIARMPSMSPYIDGGSVLATVVLCATDYCTLWEILLGPNTVAELYASPGSGLAPVTSFFNAANSSTLVDNITKYEWDWDNDGTYDEDTGTTAYVNHTYTEVGSHTATVRVTNGSMGDQVRASAKVEALPGWEHSWGSAKNDWCKDIACDYDGSIYAVGNITNGPPYDLLLMKLDMDGNLIWAKQWGGPQYDDPVGLVVDQNGDVYVAGNTDSFGAGNFDFFIQKWDSTGELEWTRTWGGTGIEKLFAIATRNNNLYLAGGSHSFGYSTGAGLLLKLDADGNQVWASVLDGSEIDRYDDIAITYSVLTSTTAIHLVGTSWSFPTDGMGAFYAKFGDDGLIDKVRVLNSTEGTIGKCIAATSYMEDKLYIGADIGNAPLETGLFLVIESDSITTAKQVDGGTAVSISDIMFSSSLGVLVLGNLYGEDPLVDAMVSRFTIEGVLQGALRWIPEDGGVSVESMITYPGSGIIINVQGAKSAGGTWDQAALLVSDFTCTWNEPAFSLTGVTGAAGSPVLAPVDITSSFVADSGGGLSDVIMLAHSVP